MTRAAQAFLPRHSLLPLSSRSTQLLRVPPTHQALVCHLLFLMPGTPLLDSSSSQPFLGVTFGKLPLTLKFHLLSTPELQSTWGSL